MSSHPHASQPNSPPAMQPDAQNGGGVQPEERDGISFSRVAAEMAQTRRKADKSRAADNGDIVPVVAEEKIVHLSALAGFGDAQAGGEPKSELAGLRKELEQMEKEREEWLHAITELLDEERELQMALELAEARMVPCEWMERALIELAASRSVTVGNLECTSVSEAISLLANHESPENQPPDARFELRVVELEAQLASAREREVAAMARADALEARLARALEQLDNLRAAVQASHAVLSDPE